MIRTPAHKAASNPPGQFTNPITAAAYRPAHGGYPSHAAPPRPSLDRTLGDYIARVSALENPFPSNAAPAGRLHAVA